MHPTINTSEETLALVSNIGLTQNMLITVFQPHKIEDRMDVAMVLARFRYGTDHGTVCPNHDFREKSIKLKNLKQ